MKITVLVSSYVMGVSIYFLALLCVKCRSVCGSHSPLSSLSLPALEDSIAEDPGKSVLVTPELSFTGKSGDTRYS